MRLVRADGAFWDVVDGDMVVCAPESGELYRLNATGAYLWEACDGVAPDALSERLTAAFPEVDAERLAADTRRFVADLRDKGLLTLAPEES